MPPTFVGFVACFVLSHAVPGLYVRLCHRIVVIPRYWCRVDSCSGGIVCDVSLVFLAVTGGRRSDALYVSIAATILVGVRC